MLAMVQELAIADNNPPIVDAPPPPQPTENALLQDNVQVEILRLLHEILTERRRGQGGRGRGSGDNNGNACGYGRGYNELNLNHHKPDNANVARRITDSYFWTYGGCNHASAKCTRKASAHKNDAAKDNFMGGSNTFWEPNVE